MPKLDLNSRLKASPAVQTALAAAKEAQQKFVDTISEFDDMLHPEIRELRLRSAMRSLRSAEDLANARKLCAELTSPATMEAKAQATRICDDALTEFKRTLPPLLDAAEAAVQDLQSEIEVGETAFFSSFDEPRTPTPLTAKGNALAATLKHFRLSLNDEAARFVNAAVNKGALGHIPAFFE